MTQSEIRNEIIRNNTWIKQFLTPNEFTLNGGVADLLMRNRELQAECGKIGHIFDEDGFCLICMTQKPEEQIND